jgi:hypothetical protein
MSHQVASLDGQRIVQIILLIIVVVTAVILVLSRTPSQ